VSAAEQERAAAEARLFPRGRAMCARAIGQPKTMRLDAKSTRTGTIVEAEPARAQRYRGGRWEVIFRIVLECGAAKARHEYHCRELPR
jgi:hypothetical protein